MTTDVVKHYDDMTPRERDAWGYEHVMGKIIRTQAEMREIAENVWKHQPNAIHFGIDGFNYIGLFGWATPYFEEVGMLRYSTDVAADNEILRIVCDVLTEHEFDCFWLALDDILGRRWQTDNDAVGWPENLSLMEYYRAGDYLHAAWLAKEE